MSAEIIPISSHAREAIKKELRTAAQGLTCFVVMPFGEKDGVNYDAAYKHLIKPAIRDAKFEVVRSDEISDPGVIHAEMLKRIIDSDLVVVDVSGANPNVFYELGVRHTARKNGTLILRRSGQRLPFNIRDMRVIDYPDCKDEEAWKAEPESVAAAQHAIQQAIITTLNPSGADSPVHTMVRGLNVSRPSRPLAYQRGKACPIDGFIRTKLSTEKLGIGKGDDLHNVQSLTKRAANKRIGIIEGDLTLVDCVDAWVNPENTRFEMARPHDNSISAIIRSHAIRGGERAFSLENDKLAGRLRKQATDVGGHVEPATAIALPPEGLQKTNKLRAIVHVAAQTGSRGRGYSTVPNIEDCVVNVLDAVDRHNQSLFRQITLRKPIRSILFPLFGTRNSDRDPEQIAERLIGSAVQYLALWPECKLNQIYFLAYSDRDRELCQRAFYRLGIAEPVMRDEQPPNNQSSPSRDGLTSPSGHNPN